MPEPPDETITFTGLKTVDGPEGEEDADNATLPENPLILPTWIVEVPDCPA